MAIGGWTSSKSKDGGVEIVDTSVSVVVDPNHNKQWEGVAAKRGGSLVASILWPYTTGETGSPAVGVSGKGGEGDLQVLVLVARGPSVREEMHQQIVRLLDGSAQETPKRKPSFYEMAKVSVLVHEFSPHCLTPPFPHVCENFATANQSRDV